MSPSFDRPETTAKPMAHRATAWSLVFTTLVGPFVCCCTTTKMASWVSVCLGMNPITCQSTDCCDETPAAPAHSHVAKHDHHSHSHTHPDAGNIAKLPPHNEQPSQPGKPCPCRQGRDDVASAPVSAGLDAKTLTTPLDFVWLTVAFDDTSAGPVSIDPGKIASLSCPAGVCSTGTDILRAYNVLRI